jgi:hypothetical protein
MAHYHDMAAESLRLVKECSDDRRRATYQNMAARWSALATEVLSQIERAGDFAPAFANREEDSVLKS